jgi:hypothetical protein
MTRPWTGSWTGNHVHDVHCVHSGAGVLLSVQTVIGTLVVRDALTVSERSPD